MRYPKVRSVVARVLRALERGGPMTRRQLVAEVQPRLHSKSWNDLFARAPSKNDERYRVRTGVYPRRHAASIPMRGMIVLQGKVGNSFVWGITAYGRGALKDAIERGVVGE